MALPAQRHGDRADPRLIDAHTCLFHRKKYGYLDEAMFRRVLQEHGAGLNIQLNDREADLVVEHVADGTGAFEPRMLASFVSVRAGPFSHTRWWLHQS